MEDKVEKLLNLTSVMDSLETMMKSQVEAMFTILGSDNDPEMDDVKEFLPYYFSTFILPIIRQKCKDIYNTHYTDAEIDGMIAFYESEVGQATIKKMPVIMGEITTLSMSMGDLCSKDMIDKQLDLWKMQKYNKLNQEENLSDKTFLN